MTNPKTARRLALLSFSLVAVLLSVRAWADTFVCKSVRAGTSTQMLAANQYRTYYTIWTSSGAPTIYWNEGAVATVPPSNGSDASSGTLTGGLSYTFGRPDDVWRGTVDAIAVSGTARVCVKSGGLY